MVNLKRFVFIASFLFLSINIGVAQNCNCNIEQVKNNTVSPCTTTIGTVVNVATTAELWNAINQVNSSGGNMTVLIADGTYPVASTSSYPYITASNVVFKSASGNRDAVILTGQGMQSNSSTENIFFLVGDNITLADMTLRDCGNHAIATNSDGHLIHNVRIQNTYEQMIKGTTDADGTNNCIVQCSLFEYTAGIGPQFYIGGLDIHVGINWEVRDNVFYDIASPSGSLAEHAIHFWDSSADNLIERNLIVNCDRGIGFGLGSSPNTGGTIKNNMIYNDGQHPFHDVGIGIESSPNTKIYNNTVLVEYYNAIEYRFTATTNADIANNLCNKPITSRNGSQATLSNNVISAANSWFVDPPNGDLHLSQNIALAVEQGTDLSPEVTLDIDQIARTAPYDIGAHEFSSSPVLSAAVDLQNDAVCLFPNPYTDSITITGDLSLYQIEVTDLYGNVLQTIPSIGNSITIDLTQLPAGMHLVTFLHLSNNSIIVDRVIKF